VKHTVSEFSKELKKIVGSFEIDAEVWGNYKIFK